MAEQVSEESHGRVLKFRPRGSIFTRPLPRPSPVKDLAKYEGNAGPDDYRHRMIMNLAGFAVTIVLVAGGLWIANTMAQLRKNQECVLIGRRNCAPIEVPSPSRW
jgi:hypothetical protein